MRKPTRLGKRLRKDPSRLFYPAPILERLPIKAVTAGELFELKQTWSYNPEIYYEDLVKLVKGEVGHDEYYRYVLKKEVGGEIEITQAKAYYEHSYLVDSFVPLFNKRHCCLSHGDWCWKNLFEHPLDIISYIQYKCKKLTRKS